jgi:CheY-like chemotaxis protein
MSAYDIPRELFNGWSVLIIDDEDDSLMIAQILLAEYGATVYTATNGAEGLAFARSHRPRFILTDLSMPIMDGWGLVHNLKNDPTLMDIPVIALTAHAMSGDRERALAVGFHSYLTKPLVVETFIQSLVRLLAEIPGLADDLNAAGV